MDVDKSLSDESDQIDHSANDEVTRTEDNIKESSATKKSLDETNPPVATEMNSAELTPLGMTSVELAPLQAVHNIITTEDSKESSNIDMDKTLTAAAYPVYVNLLSEAEDVLHRFENDTKNRYSVWRCPKDFGNSKIDMTNKRIYWQEFDIGDKITVKSDGVPFIMMGRKVYDCHFGKDRNVKLKEKMRLQREEVVKNEATKARKSPQTKKLDCPAKVVFCEIIYFPDFKISVNTKYYRGVIAKKIKESFASGSVNMENIERRIYISFPTSDEHIGHPTCIQSPNISNRIDPKVSKKLSELVLSGVRNEKEMKEKLDIYISQELYPGKAKPFYSNKRYYPTTGVIKTKMFNELVFQRLMMIDFPQIEELVTNIHNTNQEDQVYCRKFDGMNEVLERMSFNLSVEELVTDEVRVRQKISQQLFIFVHQTSFQRHLLKRYGNHVCFLDPVYRTIKYPLPLFFLMVKTNVDYQIVATFVVQDENMESIKEALEFIKSWNPEWKPKVFMVDNDSEEIATVQQCFPDCKVLLSDFHREQAWERWLSQPHNGLSAHRNAILIYLRHIAEARTEQQFEETVKLLNHTDYYQSDYGQSFRQWFKDKWLSIKERWVCVYQDILHDLIITKVKDQKKYFVHEELLNEEETQLSFVLKMITTFILPNKRNLYMEKNFLHSELTNLPPFYEQRPQWLIEYTAECMAKVNEYTAENVVVDCLGRGKFLVKSPFSHIEHQVYFGNDIELPHCDCQDWFNTMIPCEHFLVVMQHYKNWNWSCFPAQYRNSPYFTLDPITNHNSTEEDPKANRATTSVSEMEPRENRADQIESLSDPRGLRPDTNVGRVNTNDDQPERESCSDQDDNQKTSCESVLNKNMTLTNPSQDETNLSAVSSSEKSCNQQNHLLSKSLYEVLLNKKPRVKSMASECRDLINNINNLTYCIQDKTVLESLYKNLQETFNNMKQFIVDDNVGLTTEANKENEVCIIKGKKRPAEWSKNSVQKKVLKVDKHEEDKLKVNETSKEHKSEIMEPVVECDGEEHGRQNGTMNSDIHISGDICGNVMTSGNLDDTNECGRTSMSVNTRHSDATESGNQHYPQESTVNVIDPVTQNVSQSNESSVLNFTEFEDTDEVKILGSNHIDKLSKYEEKCLIKQEAVTPNIVNLVQNILEETHSSINGLQGVHRRCIQAFERVRGDFIQILHDGFGHWVCVSNLGVDIKQPDTLAFYDSMNQGFIAKFTKQQLAAFMCIQSSEMKIIMKSVQQQTSNVDCGVFAIAFATALAFGQDPSKLRFDVPKMRQHLVECLKSKKMSPFPEMKPGSSDIVLSKRKFYTVELFCSCRMPYEKPKSEADLMAQCGRCKEWFHQRCDNLKSSEHDFTCILCWKRIYRAHKHDLSNV